MTTIQQKTVDPTAHLTTEDIETLGRELDAIRQEVLDTRGSRDAAYIRKIIKSQRGLEAGSRAMLLFSVFPPFWLVGTAGLSVAKILENMEIGHNVMHGQWDWMRDPKIHSTTWEWDNASPADQWKHGHNELHHTYTNVVGKDNDLGYGIMRVDEDQRWVPFYLAQPLWNFVNACFFEYGIAAYDLELGKNLSIPKDKRSDDFKARAKQTLKKIRQQATKDYLVHPALSLPTGSFVPTLAANFTANVVRNLWTHSVIMCGHFPEGVETFEKTSIDGETRGDWYLRQMLGSANISGSPLMHLMTGNLSFQIEHHLFPDLPSNRYAEIAPQVKALFDKYELNYISAPLPKQVYSAWHKIVRLSLPNEWLAETTPKNVPSQLVKLYKMTTGGKKVRRAIELKDQLRRQADMAKAA
ncbi:fatty acid desaturase family protein [Aeromicrobium fastidiosum]|uniref:Acyl-CoA desaturase n=1 Tax=Aeromicrobium fastidiosum TaxID=52699 RepID=A0A641AQ27_9ACTN|nr:acyl-CoA desaturase [Aeromicrobium fastidiosum]KAA1379782.1 acyl-CoA desaturase [Aeromicrobium fastidiosum]MBP2389273.1 linoleoyl-CoA desaturase [Aeromicrobium fastidiosum]